MRRRALVALLALCAAALSPGLGGCRLVARPTPAPPPAPRFATGIGTAHHPISTESPEAQRWFDQGLALLYAAHREAAVDAFRHAAHIDPACAMCWWGVAYALGPALDRRLLDGRERAAAAWAAAREARRRAAGAAPIEREWIAAIETRYAPPREEQDDAQAAADRAARDRAFADAMRRLHRRHPEDLDAAVLFAESLMLLSPWDYWEDDGSPREHTPEIEHVLTYVLASNPDHEGALHLAIHLWERFEPERAEAPADRLIELAPAAGHLVHVPSHIYYRVGRYGDAAEANERAAAADVAWFTWSRAPRSYAAAYYTHDLHMLWAAALAQGQLEAAFTASQRLVAQIPDDQLAAFPHLEDQLATPVLTLARFGRWEEMLDLPAPPAARRFETAMWHYARGLACARQDRPEEARAEQAALAALAADPVLAARVFDFAGGTAGQRLALAEAHLAAELSVAEGDVDGAVERLDRAIAVQDRLPYVLPPPFYLPLRQVLGGVLLDADRAAEAEEVFAADLERYPGNGWSLFGLRRALEAQGKRTEAAVPAPTPGASLAADLGLDLGRARAPRAPWAPAGARGARPGA